MRNTYGLKGLVVAGLMAAAIVTVSAERSQAAAIVKLHPAPVGGVWATGSLIGVAAALGIYDLVRRTSCTGDFLKLGGPGFGEPIRPSDNVLVPRQCAGVRAR
ncbi:MAG: hypothetical protein J0H01_16730 [Rhizobiales bacterium]|nr:hypothetical protein [Hyphomicrobiales bacterium]